MANENYSLGISIETGGSERALASLDKGISNLQRTSQNFSKGAAQATNALGNLSRVAQDAPFGFIGIANNLNPLLESFQRLKAETGSTGSALKALGASLTGPAGIGLALATVSSLLVAFGDELFKGSSALYDNVKALQEYNEQMSKATGNAQGEIAQVQALIGVVTNETLSRQQRNKALTELQDMYPAYFANQGIDINNTDKLKAATDALSAALQRKAKAQALQNLLSQEYAKKAEIEAKGVVGNISIADKAVAILQGGLNAGAIAGNLASNSVSNYAKALADADSNISKYTQQLQSLTTEQFKNNDELGKGTQKQDTNTKSVQRATQARKAFNMELYNTKMAGQAALDAMQDISITNDNPSKPNAQGAGSSPLSLAQLMAQVEGRKNDEFFASMRQRLKENDELLKQNAASAAAFKMQLAGIAVDGFEAMINAATAADASFEKIGQALLNVIKQLAIAAAKALIFKAIIGAVSGGTTVVGGAVGGGFFGKIFGFATGGIVTGPTPAMIGEGTEAEAVMPLSQLQNVIDMNSGGNGYIADTRISGADLLLMIRRATQSGAFSGTSFG